MHTLTVKLKQHTPLIHFQHDQEGATLRASEVKPKLDRFILGKLTQAEKEEGIKAGWIKTKNDRTWLDYRMRITPPDSVTEFLLASYMKPDAIQLLKQKQITAISNTPYFAQEKQNGAIAKSKEPYDEWSKIEKKGLLSTNDIIITLLSLHNDLMKIVSHQIQSFFLSTNFGTRQSKGFGCFSPSHIMLDNHIVGLVDNEALLKQLFIFVYKKSLPQTSIERVLSTINEDYRLLKSGCTRPYAKSKLMLYADSLDNRTGWDKRYIKTNTNDVFITVNEDQCYLLKCRPENRKSSYSSRDGYLFYRALLGLAEQFEFLLDNPPAGDIRNKMIVKVKNNDIQRFQSPLLFKVFEDTIYLVGNDIPREMLGKPFQFLVNFQKDKGYHDEPVDGNGSPIETPATFSLRGFLSFAMKDTNGAQLGYITVKQ